MGSHFGAPVVVPPRSMSDSNMPAQGRRRARGPPKRGEALSWPIPSLPGLVPPASRNCGKMQRMLGSCKGSVGRRVNAAKSPGSRPCLQPSPLTVGRDLHWSPSSRGPGPRLFTPLTRVRIPSGTPPNPPRRSCEGGRTTTSRLRRTARGAECGRIGDRHARAPSPCAGRHCLVRLCRSSRTRAVERGHAASARRESAPRAVAAAQAALGRSRRPALILAQTTSLCITQIGRRGGAISSRTAGDETGFALALQRSAYFLPVAARSSRLP